MSEENMKEENNELKDSVLEEAEESFKSQEQTADETSEQAACETEEKENKSSKQDKKRDKKQDHLKEKIEELEDRVKRQMAEFDNYRKRTEKEKSTMFEIGAKSVIEKMLPVIDNFERGLTAIPEEEKDGAFAQGMDRIYKQLMSEMESIGVKAIEAEGKEFDPNLHNAVMQVESEELEAGMIAKELQKGYQYRDTVVRHSMVSVVSD